MIENKVTCNKHGDNITVMFSRNLLDGCPICSDLKWISQLQADIKRLKEELETVKAKFRHYAKDHGDDFGD